MKKYAEYIKVLNEQEFPDDETLAAQYPHLEYPGQRKQQWHIDQEATALRKNSEAEAESNNLEVLKGYQKTEIISKVSHMVTRAIAIDNSEFLDDLISLMQKYSDLLKGLKVGAEVGTEPLPIGEEL